MIAELSQVGLLQDALILIVDDSASNLRLLHFILSQAGAQILEASSAAEARRHLETSVPHVILLDVIMPETDGYQLCQEIKRSAKTAHIPIIFLSALHDSPNKVKAFSVGGSDYVATPFDAAEVLARVASHFRMTRSHRELDHERQRLLQINGELARFHEQAAKKWNPFSLGLRGQVLDGKYALAEEIGSGGFGVVYRATSLASQQEVAVKILRRIGGGRSEKRIGRFQREGIAACRVNHPNAVAILDSGTTEDGVSYLVMELLKGHPLSQELHHEQPISLTRCIQLILPVCEALIHAHQAGVVHRDIKPDNVFLHGSADDQIVKVLDFGIAKLLDDEDSSYTPLTSSGDILGTPAYMAPEQLTGEPSDGRADVYSVGVMLYEMLAGQLPFLAMKNSPMRLMLAHQSELPAPLILKNPAVPKSIADAVMTALIKEPAQRPTAAEFLRALLAAVQCI